MLICPSIFPKGGGGLWNVLVLSSWDCAPQKAGIARRAWGFCRGSEAGAPRGTPVFLPKYLKQVLFVCKDKPSYTTRLIIGWFLFVFHLGYLEMGWDLLCFSLFLPVTLPLKRREYVLLRSVWMVPHSGTDVLEETRSRPALSPSCSPLHLLENDKKRKNKVQICCTVAKSRM